MTQDNTKKKKTNKHEYRNLLEWIDQQRREYGKYQIDPSSTTILNEDRIAVLQAEHFSFCPDGQDHHGDGRKADKTTRTRTTTTKKTTPTTTIATSKWFHHYQELQEFQKIHGHTRVPGTLKKGGLGQLVVRQRMKYQAKKITAKPTTPTKTTTTTTTTTTPTNGSSTNTDDINTSSTATTSAMTTLNSIDQERIDLLNKIGFVWKVRDRPGWEERFRELLEFQSCHGHTVRKRERERERDCLATPR